MSTNSPSSFGQTLRHQFTIIGSFLAIFWGLEILNVFVFQHGLRQFGIMSHSWVGLRGILFAPFLHGGFGHLIANTMPFAILAWLVMLQETSDFWIVTILSMVVGGLGVWIFSPPGTLTVGASILIFGYIGFLLFRGFFQKNVPSIALSLLVLFLYGGTLWGIFPSDPSTSWQGHLFGFIGGAIAARLIAQEKRHYGN